MSSVPCSPPLRKAGCFAVFGRLLAARGYPCARRAGPQEESVRRVSGFPAVRLTIRKDRSRRAAGALAIAKGTLSLPGNGLGQVEQWTLEAARIAMGVSSHAARGVEVAVSSPKHMLGGKQGC